jgi:hypothetical protein
MLDASTHRGLCTTQETDRHGYAAPASIVIKLRKLLDPSVLLLLLTGQQWEAVKAQLQHSSDMHHLLPSVLCSALPHTHQLLPPQMLQGPRHALLLQYLQLLLLPIAPLPNAAAGMLHLQHL